MEGKAIVFWLVLAAGGLCFVLYIVCAMKFRGAACFGRRKKPADVEHGHALSELSAARASATTLVNDTPRTNVGGAINPHVFVPQRSDTRQSSMATLVNSPPITNVGVAYSQPGNLPSFAPETDGQSDTTSTTTTEQDTQPENENKRKLRRFNGKEDVKLLRLGKRRFNGKKDLQPLRLAYQKGETVSQRVQSARPKSLQRDAAEGDLGARIPMSAQ